MNKHNQNVLQLSIGILVAGIITGYIIIQQPRQGGTVPIAEPQVVAYMPTPNPDEYLSPETKREQVFKYANLAEAITFDPQEPTKPADLALFKPLISPDEIAYYQVGVVTNGSYKGGEVLLVFGPSEMGGGPLYHFIQKDGQLTLIQKSSEFNEEYNYMDESQFVIDNSSTLPQLTLPEKISYKNYTLSLRPYLFGWNGTPLFREYASSHPLQVIFNDSQLGDVFMDVPSTTTDLPPQNGFYIKVADGTARGYAVDIPFFDENRHIPSVTWYDGVSGDIEYAYTDVGGCGARNSASVIQGVSKSDLVVAGKTSTGEDVYILKNADHSILQNIYENDYQPYNEEKMSYAQFTAVRPAFFWFDPFDRLIKFQRMDLLPAVECGKPVIYLYPTEPTAVSITFKQTPLLSVDIPTYAAGWKVLAHPDGRLIDLQPEATACDAVDATIPGSEYAQDACAKGTYPYLYWAGKTSAIYPTPTNGWVISSEELETFLEAKLQEVGLTEQERTDMLSFWVPEILEKSAPYYRLAFFGTSQMDQFVPMKISPQPDSRLRIFLDWSPLATLPDQLPTPQHFKPFTRTGFTIVEWGGLDQ